MPSSQGAPTRQSFQEPECMEAGSTALSEDLAATSDSTVPESSTENTAMTPSRLRHIRKNNEAEQCTSEATALWPLQMYYYYSYNYYYY